jgi:hypothetical protein
MEWIIFIVLAVVVLLIIGFKTPESKGDYMLGGPIFSAAERSFFGVLNQACDGEFVIFAKVRVADIITPRKTSKRGDWQKAFNKISSKHFDYVLCEPNTLDVLAVVELDDKSHSSKKAKARDDFLNAACESAGLIMIRFKAKKAYQLSEIKVEINEALNPPDDTEIT